MAAKTRLLQATDRRTLTMAGARLVVRRGPDRGRALRIERDEVVVGSAPSADLALTDATVSRNHLVLRATPLGFLVDDLGSTNGTVFAGRRIRSAWLDVGDALDLGGTRIRIEAERQPVRFELSTEERFGRLLGRSVAARRLFALLQRVAAADATVLLTGETGSGKELAAEAIHQASARAEGPFVVVDCTTLVGALAESELLGHEKGAFSGATQRRIGLFEQAHGGTVFIDEIGDLPRELQMKLLGVLDRRELRRVGGSSVHPVDVRVIAATHRDLRVAVNQGRFREDLFYRLNVVAIRIPPLRERPDDIALLADCFWRELSDNENAALPPDELPALLSYDWPGNVRELRNRIEQLLVADAAPSTTDESAPKPRRYREAKAAALDAFERLFFAELMERAGGNVSAAARMAGMERMHLTRLLRKFRPAR